MIKWIILSICTVNIVLATRHERNPFCYEGDCKSFNEDKNMLLVPESTTEIVSLSEKEWHRADEKSVSKEETLVVFKNKEDSLCTIILEPQE